MGDKLRKTNFSRCLATISHQNSFIASWLSYSNSLNSTGGSNAVLHKDIPSFGVLTMVMESAVKTLVKKLREKFILVEIWWFWRPQNIIQTIFTLIKPNRDPSCLVWRHLHLLWFSIIYSSFSFNLSPVCIWKTSVLSNEALPEEWKMLQIKIPNITFKRTELLKSKYRQWKRNCQID